MRDGATLQRIRALVLPPAWTHVWINPDPRGHLQATGHDARGRRQYRYHPLWRQTRDRVKYSRLVSFAMVLPRIRRRVRADLALPGLQAKKVMATIVRLLEETRIRIGNEVYAAHNQSYGLTTLRNTQVQLRGEQLRFRFRGKSGKTHDILLCDKKLAPIVRACRSVPVPGLFCYRDAQGRIRDVRAQEVNAYLRTVAGEAFTAKDFRTWAGTVHTALALDGFPPAPSAAEKKRNAARAVADTARTLGNTPAVCRTSYVHPFVLDCYADQSLSRRLRRVPARQMTGLTRGEAAVLQLLRTYA